MSLDARIVLAQGATFVVIAATAVASLIQLRHLRAANEVASVRILLEEFEGGEFRDAFHFVRTELPKRLEDPSFRQDFDPARPTGWRSC